MIDFFQAITGNPLLLITALVVILLIAFTIMKQLIKWAFIIIVIAAMFIYYEVRQGKDVDDAIDEMLEQVESIDVQEAIDATGEMLEQAKEVAEDAADKAEKVKKVIDAAVE